MDTYSSEREVVEKEPKGRAKPEHWGAYFDSRRTTRVRTDAQGYACLIKPSSPNLSVENKPRSTWMTWENMLMYRVIRTTRQSKRSGRSSSRSIRNRGVHWSNLSLVVQDPLCKSSTEIHHHVILEDWCGLGSDSLTWIHSLGFDLEDLTRRDYLLLVRPLFSWLNGTVLTACLASCANLLKLYAPSVEVESEADEQAGLSRWANP